MAVNMGGIPAMNQMYQISVASRKQPDPTAQTEEKRQTGQTSDTAARQTEAAQQVQSGQQAQAQNPVALPGVEQLGSAEQTLAQMRIQPADAADRAYEAYRANRNAPAREQPPVERPSADNAASGDNASPDSATIKGDQSAQTLGGPDAMLQSGRPAPPPPGEIPQRPVNAQGVENPENAALQQQTVQQTDAAEQGRQAEETMKRGGSLPFATPVAGLF